MYTHGPSCLEGPISRKLVKRFGTSSYSQPLEVIACKNDESAREIPTADASVADTQIRWDLVHRIRRELAEGRYESHEKWQVALEKLLNHLDLK